MSVSETDLQNSSIISLRSRLVLTEEEVSTAGSDRLIRTRVRELSLPLFCCELQLCALHLLAYEKLDSTSASAAPPSECFEALWSTLALLSHCVGGGTGRVRVWHYSASESLDARELTDKFEHIMYLLARALVRHEPSRNWHGLITGKVDVFTYLLLIRLFTNNTMRNWHLLKLLIRSSFIYVYNEVSFYRVAGRGRNR